MLFDLIGFSNPKDCNPNTVTSSDEQTPAAPELFDIGTDYNMPVSTDYKSNFDYCTRLKGKNADLLIREFTLADGRRSFLLLVDGMCSKQSAEQNLILPAMQLKLNGSPDSIPPMQQLSSIILNTELSEQSSLSKGFIAALTGDLFMCIEGLNVGFVIGARSIESRSVSPSETAGSVVGPHEGFTENLRTNTALIRRRISDPNLTIEMLEVGVRSHTAVAVCYINGVTNPSLTDEVRSSIQKITVDQIKADGYGHGGTKIQRIVFGASEIAAESRQKQKREDDGGREANRRGQDAPCGLRVRFNVVDSGRRRQVRLVATADVGLVFAGANAVPWTAVRHAESRDKIVMARL